MRSDTELATICGEPLNPAINICGISRENRQRAISQDETFGLKVSYDSRVKFA